MVSIILSLAFLLLTNFITEPTTCALPTYSQHLELVDILSLRHEFQSVIGKIRIIVNQLRCPKGWRHLGGSCYYLSNITSIPTEANDTCNQLHSNHSNLMQIRNTVELFYAAHVVTKNNLSGLMIDIDSKLLKRKKFAEILIDAQDQWKRMKDQFRESRVTYYNFKKQVLDELNTTDLRILRRWKKVKQFVKKHKQKFIHNDVNDYYKKQTIKNSIFSNNVTIVDEYIYEDFNSEDEIDDFEQIEDIRGICDRINWNVINNDSTVYMLTTYLIADKIVCSLSNVKPDIEYQYVCEYVLDICFANIDCGKHGRCVNTLSGFECSCSILYDGIFCEKFSNQGKQIIIGLVLILILFGLSINLIQSVLMFPCIKFISYYKSHCKRCKRKKRNNKNNIKDDKGKLVRTEITEENHAEAEQHNTNPGGSTTAEKTIELISPIKNPINRDPIRLVWVGLLSVIFLALLLIITTITHFTLFKYNINNETKLDLLINETVHLLTQCETISNHRTENLLFCPMALALIFLFSWSMKREKLCTDLCDGRPGLLPPIEPFRTTNRFTTATVFGILAFEVLKIFEEVLVNTGNSSNRGVLIELLERIVIVLLIGLRYYPVLASLQLRNIVVRFFICPYVLSDIIYTIIREGSCMSFSPLTRYYSALEEAKLRMELGTWFIIYGLIKNTPHFILLSYMTAEVCVRFAYDSVYIPIKKKQSIWLSPVDQPDESAFAKYYVTKLFRRRLHSTQKIYSADNQSRVKKFLNSIYRTNDDFHFTTMATCTFTVAIVFLYYLACTIVFLYLSRTPYFISAIKYYTETTIDIEFQGYFSLRFTIILSAVLTTTIYAFQLYIGIQNYKKHKLQLFKGIYLNIPSAANFNSNSIASNSVHYTGFLVSYMASGFLICFHLIFFILSIIRIASLKRHHIELILDISIPILTLYLINMGILSLAGKFLFIKKSAEKLNLTNRKMYAIFIYFNFFADCFLGIASCVIHLIKATSLNVIYMTRLDCSFLGRPLEKHDPSFIAYVSYLHMEATHTNPIMLAFCYSVYDDVVKRRPKHCYDDECCIAPGELDDDEIIIEHKPKFIKMISLEACGCTTNRTSLKKRKVPTQATVPSSAKRQNSIDTNDDTTRMNPSSEQPILDNETKNQPSSEATDYRRIEEENHYDTIPTEEERAARAQVIYSSPSYDHREAQHSTPPLTQRRTTDSSSLRTYTKTDNNGSFQSLSNHSMEQQNKHSLQQTLKDERPEEEDEEEDDDDEKQENKISTAASTISYLVQPEKVRVFDNITKQKQARFRWFLAYTLLNNYRLFGLRKQVKIRLARLQLEQSILAHKKSPEFPSIRQRHIESTTTTSETSVSPEQLPSVVSRLTFIPTHVINRYPSCPAERYITCLSTLNDVTVQQINTSPSSDVSQVSSTVGQQPPIRRESNLNAKTLSFQNSSQVKTINEKTKKNQKTLTNPVSGVVENQSSEIISALVHRKDSSDES